MARHIKSILLLDLAHDSEAHLNEEWLGTMMSSSRGKREEIDARKRRRSVDSQ